MAYCRRAAFSLLCSVHGLRFLGSACSRTGLDLDMVVEETTGGAGGTLATGGGGSAPRTASGRWIAVHADDGIGEPRLYGIRLGISTVEDVIRLDPQDRVLDYVAGQFSHAGRAIAVSVSDQSNGPVTSSRVHAALLWDFSTIHPTPIEPPAAPTGLENRFGPWLDEHRAIVLQAPPGDSYTPAENCLIVDLDRATSSVDIDFGFDGASCGGFFAVSPGQKWLAALVRFGDTSQALVVGKLGSNSVGPFTRVADVPVGQTAAKVFFSPNDDYLALENVVIGGGLSLDIPIVALTNPPVAKATFHVTSAQYLNFVQWAPSGPRFMVHTTRIDETMRGSNPVFVSDAETGTVQELTPQYQTGSAAGLTAEGSGLIADAYDDGSVAYPVEWVPTGDLSAPPTFSSRVWLATDGAPISEGFLNPDGSAFFGFSGSSLVSNTSDLFDLSRFDFTPSTTGFAEQTWQLSEHAPIRRWVPSPKADYVVYHVAVTSSVFNAADLLTRSHYTSEAGTYLLALNDTKPQPLPIDWNSYQSVHWLPDASGILRYGPVTARSAELDFTIDDGQLTLIDPSLHTSIIWVTLNGTTPIVTDLTQVFDKGFYPTSDSVEMAEIWSSDL